MNALKLLKNDHRAVEALFKQFEKAGDKAFKEKQELARKIVKELAIHASIEEELLYPAARAHDERLEDQVLEALEEHHVAKWTLNEIERMSPEDERFDAKVTVLMENIRHHVKEEETELFPKLERVMGKAELNALGAALEQAKTLAPTHPHPMSPDTPPGNVISDALAKILDMGRDAAREVGRRAGKVATQMVNRAKNPRGTAKASGGTAKRAATAKRSAAAKRGARRTAAAR
ncbi:hemerythrin domain-containing protein [Cystobacter fuscus]|uniref:hemerythrin domain-containing protein n=1 Tax=Cystobacter fuscus TaxID=43 RepID=UPI002B2AA759|nr:hemerythrin domain-containing protein [Cystobacter fuscus]